MKTLYVSITTEEGELLDRFAIGATVEEADAIGEDSECLAGRWNIEALADRVRRCFGRRAS